MSNDDLVSIAEKALVGGGDKWPWRGLQEICRQWLASDWRTDFENCPRDEFVLVGGGFGVDEVPFVFLSFFDDRPRATTHWKPFVPPTRKEG